MWTHAVLLMLNLWYRAEIDRLTELLQSRSDDLHNGVEGKRTEANLLQPVSAIVRRDEVASSPVQENRIERHLESRRFHGSISTPVVSSQVKLTSSSLIFCIWQICECFFFWYLCFNDYKYLTLFTLVQ